MDNLRYIRRTMERASSFTAISGAGCAGAGLVALVGATLTFRRSIETYWLTVWGLAALAAVTLWAWTSHRKAKAAGMALLGEPGRKFLLCLAPAITAGAALTASWSDPGANTRLPGMWLLL